MVFNPNDRVRDCFFFHPDHHEGRGAGAGHEGAPVVLFFVFAWSILSVGRVLAFRINKNPYG